MAKSRAQQAAIAISMKKRGKKPKKLRKGGFDLLKKYQPGGFSNFGQIEYGPNILQVPGADADAQKYLELTTAAYQQDVQNRENQLLATQQYYQQLADAEANQNIQSGTAQLLNKFRTAEGKGLGEKATDLFTNTFDAALYAESINPTIQLGGEATSAFATDLGYVPKGAQSIQMADGAYASLPPGAAVPEGATVLGTAPSAATQAASNFATNTAVGSTTASVGGAVSPYALPAYVVGEGIGYFADDDDPTTWTAGEIAGDVLSTAGKRVGQGALIGSVAGPPGQALGAGIGLVAGTVESIVRGLTGRKKARDAEEDREEEEMRLYNEFMANRRAQMRRMAPDYLQQGTLYRGKMGGIKPMNNQGDLVVYGPTHEQGGVMRDSTTELEGGGMKGGVALPGEVITNVKDSEGNTREYYFSDHLKNPSTGNTFAEDYRKSGGMNYNAKQMFAKLQEQVASKNDKDRSPQTIAEDGGFSMMLPTMPSDTIQGMSMDQMTARKKFQANLKRQGINPYSPIVKQNTDILKNSEGNYIYRYITPPTDGMRDGGMGKRLEDIAGQLTKASKMHAGQSKKIGSMAKQIMKKAKKGGYKMYQDGGEDDVAAKVTLPEVEVKDRRTRSELEKFLNVEGLKRELEFLNEAVLPRTPLKGETDAETLMNIASMNPLGLGKLGILNTGKYLKKIAQPFRDIMTYTNVGRKGKAGKEVVGKPLPTFEDISKTIRVPSKGGTGTNVGPGSVLLPRGGTTTKRMVTTGPDGKRQVVEYTGDLLPATIRSQRTRTKAKDVLDKIRKFTKENKTDIGLLSTMGGALLSSLESEPDSTVRNMEQLNELLQERTQSDILTKRDTSGLSSAQEYIMESLKDPVNPMSYLEVKHLGDSNPLQLQSVIDSVKKAQGFEHGGFHPPQKPRVGRFTLENQPSRFDRSMEANMFRNSLRSYNKALEAMQTTEDSLINPITTPATLTPDLSLPQDTMPAAPTPMVQPTIGMRTTQQAEDLTAVKALTADQVAEMTDEELDAYMNTFALDPNVVKVGEVDVVDESPETRKAREAVEASRKRGAPTTALPIQGLIPTAGAQPLMATMPKDTRRALSTDFDPNKPMTSGYVVPSPTEGLVEIDPNTAVMPSRDMSAEDRERERISRELAKIDLGPEIEEEEETVDDTPKPKADDFNVKSLLSKVGLDKVKPLDVLGVAAAGLGFAKANKLAKEMGDLELKIKGDISVDNIPKQKVSMEAEKVKLQQDTNALVQSMTEQGKSTAEIAAIRAQGDEAIAKIGQAEKNMQSQLDLKTDALNAANNFKKNAANKNIELSKALADLDISAAEKRNRMNIWNKLTNEVIGMGLDRAKLKSVEKQFDSLAESIAKGNEALMKTLTEDIRKQLGKK